MRNRWMKVLREIRLNELMKLIPDDELVIIFRDTADLNDEGQALFNGQVMDYWKDLACTDEMQRAWVNGFQSRELTDTIGPGTMIVIY